MDEGPGWGGKALVIRGGGLRIQILATAADRTGRLVSEGKLSMAVPAFGVSLLISTGQLVDEGPGWGKKSRVLYVVHAYRSWPPPRTERVDSSLKGR